MAAHLVDPVVIVQCERGTGSLLWVIDSCRFSSSLLWLGRCGQNESAVKELVVLSMMPDSLSDRVIGSSAVPIKLLVDEESPRGVLIDTGNNLGRALSEIGLKTERVGTRGRFGVSMMAVWARPKDLARAVAQSRKVKGVEYEVSEWRDFKAEKVGLSHRSLHRLGSHDRQARQDPSDCERCCFSCVLLVNGQCPNQCWGALEGDSLLAD